MKRIKFLFTIITMLVLTGCNNDLNQLPALEIEQSKLEDFGPILNAAYYYQTGVATPQIVLGDFRADNMLMIESPFTSMDTFNSDLGGGDMAGAFFSPIYTNLYKSILSANNVIENSSESHEVAEAHFLRGLSYFKLVMIFGDIPVNLSANPDPMDQSILVRQPKADVYNDVIIPDFKAAIADLDNSGLGSGRASQIAAHAFLGKVYMHRSDFADAVDELESVVNNADGVNITLESNFANVVDDESTEILFATKISSSISNAKGSTSSSNFVGWFAGADTKSTTPLDPRLIDAFDASSETGGGVDLRKELTIDVLNQNGKKYNGAEEQDFIEMRLSDVILLYAEALNETTNADGAQSSTILSKLDAIRTRAGLTSLTGTATTQSSVRTAIAKERRVELALEGHRWFDLVRTDKVDSEMGLTIDSNYYVFPIPNSEILASDGVITQNPGY